MVKHPNLAMRLLLHICCAPCLIHPLESLRAQGNDVDGIFYNPNIHPWQEYKKRLIALQTLSKTYNLKVEIPEYHPEEFFQEVNNHERSPQRCLRCFALRLKKTAMLAKENKMDGFSTTLLVSPYQDHKLLSDLGQEISREQGIHFYYQDFRVGFRWAHQLARNLGVYCQNYCGCIYSEIERFQKKAGKDE